MNPMTLLRLWRERWGLSEGRSPGEAYLVDAGRTTWGIGWARSSFWAVRGTTWLALLLALPPVVAAALVPTDTGGQWMFGAILLAMALYVRRYMGTLPFLVLIGLTLLAGARYLAWRYEATLPSTPWPMLGWLLWAAEGVAWLYLTLSMCSYLWPVARPSTELAEVIEEWPYVDVLVVAGSAGLPVVQALLRAVRALDWPGDRLRVFVQDAEGIREWRRDGLHPAPGAPAAATELPQGNGALVLRVHAEGPQGQLDDPMLLQHWAVWMQRDPFLALLHGHASDLAFVPSPQARALLRATPGAAVELMRRTAVAESSRAPSTGSLAERLERYGHRTALMGMAEHQDDAGTDSRWLRLDAAHDTGSMHARLRWRALVRALRGPARAMPYALAAAGVALPLFGVLPIAATLPGFLAYALPYAALAGLSWGRTRAPRRAAVVPELRDWGLALILPPLTALHALAAVLRGRRPTVASFGSAHRRPSRRRMVGSVGALVEGSWWLLAAVALMVGAWRLHAASPAMRPWFVAACVAIGYALSLRIARWAVEQETRSLRAEQAAMRIQSALLEIAGDGPVAVDVLGFPAQPLRLRVPDIAQIGHGSLGWQALNDGHDLPAGLRLREASDVPLHGHCRLGPSRELWLVPDPASAERLEHLGERLQVRYLKRHYWVPGSRLRDALREALFARVSRPVKADPSTTPSLRRERALARSVPAGSERPDDGATPAFLEGRVQTGLAYGTENSSMETSTS